LVIPEYLSKYWNLSASGGLKFIRRVLHFLE
jgi:hypothetical protein